MKKRIVIATLLVTAVATLAVADRPHRRFGHHGFGHGFGPLAASRTSGASST